MRIKPRRETRGVSRSKCGDLITACVPVSWAASIIVSESTDAIDYYDGFGTTELVIGIRAYQWGWEYYYPKDIDLNYNLKKNNSNFIGNSLKYKKTSEITLNSTNLWKFYQNKTSDQPILPAYLLTIPFDNAKILNFLNFNDIGANSLYEANAFKKIRMFSKTYTTNLFFNNNNFSTKYNKFINMYITDNSFVNSNNYGTQRQHNYLSNSALFTNQNSFLNEPSLLKLLKFNFSSTISNNNMFSSFSNFNYWNESNGNFSINNKNLNIFNFFEQKTINFNKQFFKNFYFYNSYLQKINNDTDEKKILFPIKKLFNNKFKKINIFNLNNNNVINNSIQDFFIFKNNSANNSLFNNRNKTFKTFSAFSPNQSIGLKDRYIRNFLTISPHLPTLNFTPTLNSLNNYLFFHTNKIEMTNFFLYNINSLNWIDVFANLKLSTNKITFDYPYSPITSNKPTFNHSKYDSVKNSFTKDTPSMLQGKEETMPNFLPSVYWNFFWANSGNHFKIKNNYMLNQILSSSYLPFFSFYYDYDFRNWQFLELLEDSFWESIYPSYLYDEYLLLNKNFYSISFFNKNLILFNQFNKLWNDKIFDTENISNSSFKLFNNTTAYAYTHSFYSEELFNINSLTNTKNFFVYPTSFNFLNNDDNYENFKNLTFLFNQATSGIISYSSNILNSHNYSTVLDCFRSDFDEFSWFLEDFIFFNFNDFLLKNKIAKISELIDFGDINFFINNNLIKNNKINNEINLRPTAKNAMVTFNAIQKVFKTRFDENRSHARFIDLNNFYVKQPFISSPRTPFENLLGKNKENFYKNISYKTNSKYFLNNAYYNSTSLNFYFFDFPFLMSLKSDSSRYLWFDWYSKWGFYEIQPSSSSRYAIHGMPYFSKNFEYNSTNNENLNETETYLIRLSKSRRNYLPNWAYSPYFYSKNNFWYKNYIIFNNKNFTISSKNSLINTKYLLTSMNWYTNTFYFFDFNINLFIPSISNTTTYSKGFWKPQNSIQSYYFTLSTLVDILTKREFLIRELLFKNNNIINLPIHLLNSPKNPIISEIKSNFLFFDIISKNNEYSKNIHYTSLVFFNLTMAKELIQILNFSPFFQKLINNYYFYFFQTKNLTNLSDYNNANDLLLKNQYRPMKKGITNMIRLHATGAMALPIEIRLQILASSKDVIHSWAIPSAGIKIDCVPGYSSHRVMIFLVSGIFWGQCMEICGRYHHWMPIVVYFMKRDLFFLWCTHFIFLSGANNQWTINDKQYVDYAKVVSFDKASWITELSNN
jgi:hypothetical protein